MVLLLQYSTYYATVLASAAAAVIRPPQQLPDVLHNLTFPIGVPTSNISNAFANPSSSPPVLSHKKTC